MRKNIKTKENLCQCGDPLYPMFAKMFEKIDTSLEKAVACETLVILTLLNPSFRLAIFESNFPKEAKNGKGTTPPVVGREKKPSD
jgi:hypothetical protein